MGKGWHWSGALRGRGSTGGQGHSLSNGGPPTFRKFPSPHPLLSPCLSPCSSLGFPSPSTNPVRPCRNNTSPTQDRLSLASSLSDASFQESARYKGIKGNGDSWLEQPEQQQAGPQLSVAPHQRENIALIRSTFLPICLCYAPRAITWSDFLCSWCQGHPCFWMDRGFPAKGFRGTQDLTFLPHGQQSERHHQSQHSRLIESGDCFPRSL